MVGSRLRAFGRELGFKYNGDIVYGATDGYCVSIFEDNGIKTLYIDVRMGASMELQKKAVSDYISENSILYYIIGFEVRNTGIRVDFGNKPGVTERLKEFFFSLLLILQNHGIAGDTVCTNCGRPLSDERRLVSVAGFVHSCCQPCAERLLSSSAAGVKRAVRKNTLVGLIGALLGVFLGSLIYILVCQYGIYAAGVGIVVALLAKTGYVLFGGQRSLTQAVMLPVLSVAGVLAGQLAGECYKVASGWSAGGFVYGWGEVLNSTLSALVADVAFRNAYLLNSAVGCALALLALVALMSISRRKTSGMREVMLLEP